MNREAWFLCLLLSHSEFFAEKLDHMGECVCCWPSRLYYFSLHHVGGLLPQRRRWLGSEILVSANTCSITVFSQRQNPLKNKIL